MKLSVCDGDRQQQAFSNPLISWRFKIITGPRCSGLVSVKTYKSPDLAFKAGERMMDRLKSNA